MAKARPMMPLPIIATRSVMMRKAPSFAVSGVGVGLA
jgi:hypothetical protein